MSSGSPIDVQWKNTYESNLYYHKTLPGNFLKQNGIFGNIILQKNLQNILSIQKPDIYKETKSFRPLFYFLWASTNVKSSKVLFCLQFLCLFFYLNLR